ncbi:MAG: transposase [Bacteroidota bacterium]|nr:transposase [Bacteroidota bacterium]
MSSGMGAPAIDARVVPGTIIIKHLQKLDDWCTIEIIQENPYMQYFLDLKGFTCKPVFRSFSFCNDPQTARY